MSKVLLISIETLKKEYLIDDNLDDKYLLSNIQKGQDFRIKSLMEETRYNQLISEIEDGNVSVANKTVLDVYIKPILAYFVMSEVVYTTAYKLKNLGMGGTEDKANQYRFKELIEISNKYRRDSEQYEMIFKEHIRLTGDVQISPTYEYKSSIYLGMNDVYKSGYNTIAHKNERKGTGI